eukprot:m.123629 g.123629  ORF g.123629 m.123629 type:complete len:63 (+) comp37826_c0_seq3:296-484(+)
MCVCEGLKFDFWKSTNQSLIKIIEACGIITVKTRKPALSSHWHSLLGSENSECQSSDSESDG